MHRDHDIFARAVEREAKVKLTFYSSKHRRNMVRPAAPLHYSEGMRAGDDNDCYYFWDFEAPKGRNFLALRSSQIVSMQPTEDIFRLDEITSLSKMIGDSTTTGNTSSNKQG
ncbi:MAG: hypothetical protein JSW66_20195 [Phycisphaerales bacterium]|nr:MAG: hypothetical protein JSW66_20195 [Phycisphaerales bacterium]